jgi:hypothetical protein
VYVRSSLPSDTVGLTSLEQSEAVMSGGHNILALTLHKNTGVLILPDIQWLARVPILKQVEEPLIIYLQEGAIHCIALVTGCHHAAEASEKVLYSSRDDTELLLILKEWVASTLIGFK